MQNFLAKADLHLHSKASKEPAGWFSKIVNCAESYVEPLEIYYTLKERGMDFITITDHNTIEGVLEIAHFPEVFISCEYTVAFPEEEAFVHVLVFGIKEEEHGELLKLRNNLYEFVSYLKISQIPHALAHPFYPIEGTKITKRLIEKLLLLFDNWELINGTRGDGVRHLEEAILRKYDGWEKIKKLEEKYEIKSLRTREKVSFTAGTDDHSGLYVGLTKTLVKGACNVEGFLKGLLEGRTEIHTEELAEERLFNMIAKIGYHCMERKYPFPEEVKPFLDYMLKRSQENLQISYILQYIFGVNGDRYSLLKKVVSQLPFLTLNRLAQNPSLQGLGEVIVSWLLHLVPAFLKMFYKKEEERAFNLAREFEINYLQEPKIAYLTDTFYDINGVARTAQIIKEIIEKEKLPFTLVISSEKEIREEKFVSLKGYMSFSVPFYQEFKMYIPSLIELSDFISSEKFTHLHIATPGPLGLMAFLIGKLLGLRITFAYHTDLPKYAKIYTKDDNVENLFWKVLILLINNSDSCFVPSMYYKELLEAKGALSSKLLVFKRGVDMSVFSPYKRDKNYWKRLLGLRDEDKVVLYVGRISKEKGLDKIIEIAKALPDLYFVLVGDGPYKEELQRKSPANIYFVGVKEGEDLAKAYASSHLFLFPSETDTYALVVLEALASGLPVIVCSKGGAAENVKDGINGFIVTELKEYIEKIKYILSDAQLWQVMSLKAYESAKSLDMKASYLDFLHQIAHIGIKK